MELIEKICTSCGENKPASEFNKGSGYRNGIKARCRVCEYAAGKKYLAENAEKRLETVRKYRNANKEMLAARLKEYKIKNADAIRQKNSEYNKRTVEQQKERHAVHYKNNKEKILRQKKEYYERHPEKLYEKGAKYFKLNSKSILERTAKYRKSNPDKSRERVIRRRTKKLNATPSWFAEFDDMVIKEATRLAVQREAITGFKWHVDHIVPLQGRTVCGLHVGANIAVISQVENLMKSNRWWPDKP